MLLTVQHAEPIADGGTLWRRRHRRIGSGVMHGEQH